MEVNGVRRETLFDDDQLSSTRCYVSTEGLVEGEDIVKECTYLHDKDGSSEALIGENR